MTEYTCDPMFKMGDLVIYVCYQFVFTIPLSALLKAHRGEEKPEEPAVKTHRVKRSKLIEVDETADHTLTTETETVITITEISDPGQSVADMRTKPHPFGPPTTMLHLGDKKARQILADAEEMKGDAAVDGPVSRWADFCDEAANQTHEGMALGEVLTRPMSDFTKANAAVAL